MKKKGRLSERPSRFSSPAISKSALADFLAQLAALYASPEYGNLSLAAALRDLAGSVRRGVPYNTRNSLFSKEKTAARPVPDFEFLRTLDSQAIEHFIADESKSKNELMDLAMARFSIPSSQLKRMKVAEVRRAIKSALLHESSIEILSEEAKRDGSARSS